MRRFVYIGKNHRFTAFLDSNLHTRRAIVTANELGLAFPPRKLPKKFVQSYTVLKGSSGVYKIRVLPSGTLSQTPDCEDFAAVY